MDRFYVQRMPENELDVVFRAEVGDPVPGEYTLDAGYHVVAEGLFVWSLRTPRLLPTAQVKRAATCRFAARGQSHLGPGSPHDIFFESTLRQT